MTNTFHDSPDPDQADLIDRYLADELSGDGLRALQKGLELQPESNDRLELLKLTVSEPIARPAPYNIDSRVQHILSALDSPSNAVKGAPDLARKPWLQRMAFAAVICAVAAVGIIWSPLSKSTYDAPVTLVKTAKGERSTIHLADGTTVTLNVDSELHVSQDFLSSRTIELTGEAYFHVTHSSANPFKVITNGISTTVLGTEFAVRSYPAEETRVTVRSGKVSVAGVVLEANSSAHVHNKDSISIVRYSNLNSQFAFLTGTLNINNMRLKDAIADLSRWYNIDIAIADSAVANMLFSAVLPNGSAADLVDILKLTLPVEASITGKHLTLKSR